MGASGLNLGQIHDRSTTRLHRERASGDDVTLDFNAHIRGAARLGRGKEGQGPRAARRGRHLRPAARRHCPCRRHPGRRWCRRPAAPAEAALPVAQAGVRRWRLRPARGPARPPPARADPGRDQTPRRDRGLRPPPPPLGGGAHPRLAWPVAAAGQGIRSAARGLADHGHAGHDPPHAAPPRQPEPQAATRSLTSQTASEFLNNDFKQAMARHRTPPDKTALKSGLTSYMHSLQHCPAKVRTFFQAPSVRYAA
jgi:hypothetical protein